MAGRVRALIVKTALERLEDHPRSARDAIRNRLDSDMLDRADHALRMGWLPVEDFYALGSAIAAEFDESEQQRHWFDVFDLEFDRSLLAPLINGAIHLFGPTPRGLCRVLPRAWSSLFTAGAPKFEFVAVDDAMELPMCDMALRDLPTEPVAAIVRVAMKGVFGLFYARCETVGEVLCSVAPSGDRFDLDIQLEWEAVLKPTG